MKNTCCFAGHSKYAYTKVTKEAVQNCVNIFIELFGVTEFMVGNYGDFDRLCASVLKEAKQKFPHIKILLTVPYLTKSAKERADEFDEIVIPELPESTPRNLKIIKCNEFMVDKSRYMISFVKHSWGGAAKTLEYAQKKNKNQKEQRIDIYYIAQMED